MTPTRFFLVRHALVEPSARAVLYGSMDVALCDLALREEAAALSLARAAAAEAGAVVRHQPVAHALHRRGHLRRGLSGRRAGGQEPDLAEQHLGEWQGIPHDALPALLTHPAHPFWPHGGEEHPPGGESFREVQARVAAVMERMATLLEGQDVVIVAHGGSIRAALAHAMGLTPDQALIFSIKNLSHDADRETRAGLARRGGERGALDAARDQDD